MTTWIIQKKINNKTRGCVIFSDVPIQDFLKWEATEKDSKLHFYLIALKKKKKIDIGITLNNLIDSQYTETFDQNVI